jgi:DNA-directed RNA polymerase specialized sigma24 family protein
MPAPTTAARSAPAEPVTDGFEAFYRAHVDRVYRALAVTLRRDDLAHEAVDEAMARAYARWSVVGTLDNPAGWVFRVGLNWATSWWRKLRRETPPVVTCRILLDLSTAETAEALGLSEGTVKSRLSRGLAALRAQLSSEE